MKPVVPPLQGLRFTETTNPGRRSRWSLAPGWHHFAPLGRKSKTAQVQNARAMASTPVPPQPSLARRAGFEGKALKLSRAITSLGPSTGSNCRCSLANRLCSCRSVPKPKLTLKNRPPYIPAPFPPGVSSRLVGRLLVRSVEPQTTRFLGPDAAKVMSMRRPELQGRLSSDSSSNDRCQQISVTMTAAGLGRAKQPFTRERPCRAINTRCESAGY